METKNAQDTSVQLSGTHIARQTVIEREYPHVIQAVKRRVGISLDYIMSRILRLEKADNFDDSSSEEGNDTLRDEFRALREKVTLLRRTNAVTPNGNSHNNPESQSTAPSEVSLGQGPTPPARDHVCSPIISTV